MRLALAPGALGQSERQPADNLRRIGRNDPSRHGSLLHNNPESAMEVKDEVPTDLRYA